MKDWLLERFRRFPQMHQWLFWCRVTAVYQHEVPAWIASLVAVLSVAGLAWAATGWTQRPSPSGVQLYLPLLVAMIVGLLTLRSGGFFLGVSRLLFLPLANVALVTAVAAAMAPGFAGSLHPQSLVFWTMSASFLAFGLLWRMCNSMVHHWLGYRRVRAKHLEAAKAMATPGSGPLVVEITGQPPGEHFAVKVHNAEPPIPARIARSIFDEAYCEEIEDGWMFLLNEARVEQRPEPSGYREVHFAGEVVGCGEQELVGSDGELGRGGAPFSGMLAVGAAALVAVDVLLLAASLAAASFAAASLLS